MKIRGIRMLSLLMALALCVSLIPVPAMAAEGVSTWVDSIGGASARVVSVDMIPGRTGQISLANNSVVSDMPAATHIANVNAQAGVTVAAAINGGFFNSYTSGAQAFPNNCPAIMDAVVVNNQLVHTGRSSILGFTADGKPMIDWVTLKAVVRLGPEAFPAGCWSVNTYENDPWSISLFDEHLTLPVAIPASFTMFYIANGQVTQVSPGGVLSNIPAGAHVLVYGPDVVAEETSHHRLPEVGMSAEVAFTASGTARDAAWEQVETALTGGPVLVKNGQNVVDNANNSVYYGDSKQKPDTVLARTFIGVTANGSLLMGSVTSSFRRIADWLVAKGVQEAVAMDGGGSCMLYANGSYVTGPGRSLACVLTIVDRTGAAPSRPSTPAVNVNEPAAWAAADVQRAVSLGLVPQSLQTGYQRNISRKNFCILAWELIKKDPNYMEKMLWNRPRVTFSDTDQAEVEWCATAGIIDGTGNGQFSPNGELTREQAAKILTNTLLKLGEPYSGGQVYFSDRASFSGWAVEGIDFCASHGIMKGVSDDVFGPTEKFTTQQAVVTMLRLYDDYVSKY